MEILDISCRKARLADRRIRIARDETCPEPSDIMDLAFERAETPDSVPENAIRSWETELGGERAVFFTTAERCRKTVSGKETDWSGGGLDSLESDEKEIWRNWKDGHVYGWILEEWDPDERLWTEKDSCWGYFGADGIIEAIKNEVLDFEPDADPGENETVICASDDILGEIGSRRKI